MKPRCGNISCATRVNNAGPRTPGARAGLRPRVGHARTLPFGRLGYTGEWSRTALGIALLLPLGCAATPPKTAAVVPIWELASAEPSCPTPLSRARIAYDRPLPAYLTQRLSEDFTLVSITRPQDWKDVCHRLGLTPTSEPDFARGMVAGIIAQVGEPSRPSCWPVSIKAIRTRRGLGSVEAEFAPGLYYPLRTAGYLDLVYVPDVQAIGMVRIGERTFIIRSAAPVY
jgi:hypothetical protein